MSNHVMTAGMVFVLVTTVIYWMNRMMRRKTPIKNKVVLITGASSGLGEACAHVFYRAGAKVILCSRRKAELERVKNDLLNSYSRNKKGSDSSTQEPRILVLDLEKFGDMPQKIQEALSLFGTIDILVNNGGVSYRGTVLDTTLDVDIRVMNVNYFGQVALTKAILPHMIKQGSGHIVAVSSVQGKISIPYRSPYSASKHALQAFCDCLRAEVAECGVKVSVVSPGYVQTNLSVNALTADGSQYGVTDETTAKGMSPNAVAERIMNAVQYNVKEDIVAPFTHRLVVLGRNILSGIFFKIMQSRAKKQKHSYAR